MFLSGSESEATPRVAIVHITMSRKQHLCFFLLIVFLNKQHANVRWPVQHRPDMCAYLITCLLEARAPEDTRTCRCHRTEMEGDCDVVSAHRAG